MEKEKGGGRGVCVCVRVEGGGFQLTHMVPTLTLVTLVMPTNFTDDDLPSTFDLNSCNSTGITIDI